MEKRENGKEKGHNSVERITFVFGLLVIASLLTFLIYQLTQKSGKPPQLIVTSTYQADLEPYGFEIQVVNKGDQTAENAVISLDLYQNDSIIASGSLEMNYVPVKSKETAWIVFNQSRMPNDSLVVSSVSYVKP